jgi:hypothetical protein
MITPKRVKVGTEPVDLTDGSKTSGTSIQFLRNAGDTTLYIGDLESGIPLEPGEQLPGMTLSPQDKLWAVREDGEGDVHLVVGWA